MVVENVNQCKITYGCNGSDGRLKCQSRIRFYLARHY